MTRKGLCQWSALGLLLMAIGCSSPADRSDSKAEDSQPAQEAAKPTPEMTEIYEVSKEDITKIPNLTSRNVAINGVKLGDKTVEVQKILGQPIKTDATPKLYRSSYLDHGLYLDFDRYTGRVIAMYINTNYYKKAKGNISDLLAHGKLDLLKKCFGDNPAETQPDRYTTMWDFPDKGVQFIHIKQAGTASYTLKFVEPKG
ncbi:MAG: hypothetical protein AB1898_10195 [Acidobacteriota bacterium]